MTEPKADMSQAAQALLAEMRSAARATLRRQSRHGATSPTRVTVMSLTTAGIQH
jgi:hypothetical protein